MRGLARCGSLRQVVRRHSLFSRLDQLLVQREFASNQGACGFRTAALSRSTSSSGENTQELRYSPSEKTLWVLAVRFQAAAGFSMLLRTPTYYGGAATQYYHPSELIIVHEIRQLHSPQRSRGRFESSFLDAVSSSPMKNNQNVNPIAP